MPFATDKVPFEGPIMYPGVRFIPRGVGVRKLTPEGYEPAWNGILPAAESLAAQNVDAIMVIGTSLTFYRGHEAHDRLLEELRQRTGLPVSTMSQSIVDGLREVGASARRRRHRLQRRRQPAPEGIARGVRHRGAVAGRLRPFRIRRPGKKERSRHHRAERQRALPAPKAPRAF